MSSRLANHAALLLAGALLASPAVLSAQAEFGLKGGVSFGDVSNKGVLPGSLDGRTGLAAGVSLGLQMHAIGIGMEALFAQRGYTAEPASVDERKLNYLDIPVYLKVGIPLQGLAPFVYAGPQVSFELSCRADESDCPDLDREKLDYAGIIGVGARLGERAGYGLTLEARYIYGLRDLKPSTITSDDSFKTRSFLLLAGIAF